MATQRELADHLDVSLSTLEGYFRDGILERQKTRGGHDIDEQRVRYLRWARGVIRGRIKSGDTTTEVLDLTKERARKERALADKNEMENAIARGELINVTELENRLVPVAVTLAGALDTAVSVIRNRCPGLAARDMDIIRTEIAKARNRIADFNIEEGTDESEESVG